MNNKAYTIKISTKVDPEKDTSWIAAGDGYWFKPVRLDAVHSFYTCYWLATIVDKGQFHYHSGSTHGIVLQGSVKFSDIHSQETEVAENQAVYIPPGVTHKAENSLNDGQFLFYGTIEASIIYLNEKQEPNSTIDVFTYIDLARKHYQKNNLDMQLLERLIVE